MEASEAPEDVDLYPKGNREPGEGRAPTVTSAFLSLPRLLCGEHVAGGTRKKKRFVLASR